VPAVFLAMFAFTALSELINVTTLLILIHNNPYRWYLPQSPRLICRPNSLDL
jgi:hypothetical protein